MHDHYYLLIISDVGFVMEHWYSCWIQTVPADRSRRCDGRLRYLRVRLHPWENGVDTGRARLAAYWPDLHAFLLKLIVQSCVWAFLCVSPSPAGVVQVPGPSGVSPGRAHHHLWRHQTCSRDAVSQFAQVTGELMRNLRSFHLNFLV